MVGRAAVTLWLSCPAALLIALRAEGQSAAQGVARSATQRLDTIRGHVIGAGSSGVPEVTVTVTSGADQSWKSVQTDTAGAYQVVFAAHSAQYTVAIMRLGFTPQRRQIAVGDDHAVAVDFRLAAIERVLPPVVSIAQRPRPRRDDSAAQRTPGATVRAADQSSGLNGDLTGDLDAALATVPGISVVPGGDGAFGVTAFGLTPSDNRFTLDGMDAPSGVSLRDGLTSAVALSAYDPRRGRATGALIDLTLPSGADLHDRTLHFTGDDPALQRTMASSVARANRPRSVIASGTAAGPIVADHAWYNSTLQFSHERRELPTLQSADAASLAALGVEPDFVRAFESAASQLGVPLDATVGARTRTAARGLVRIDVAQLAPTERAVDGQRFTITGGAGHTSDAGIGRSATAAASQSSVSVHDDAQLVAHQSMFLFGGALNDLKGSASFSATRSDPYVVGPQALVRVASELASRAGFATLSGGGNAVAASRDRRSRWELSNETSWMTWDARHKLGVFIDVEADRLSSAAAANPGTYEFNSLADFASNRPTSFRRVLGETALTSEAYLATLGLSDVYSSRPVTGPSVGGAGQDGLQVQYGVRADAERLSVRVSADPVIDSLFGRRTDRLPRFATFSPMLGFTYNRGTTVQISDAANGRFAIRPEPRHSLSGGAREYWSTLTPDAVNRALATGGAGGGVRDLECIGSAAPTLDRRDYASGSGGPTDCLNASSALAQGQRTGVLFAPNFLPSRNWRAELNWSFLLSGQLRGWLGTMYTLNEGQPEPVDLNFDPSHRFTLSNEGNRPVFAIPEDIVPMNGALLATGSRRFPDLGHVTEMRSSLRSDQRQFTAGLTYRIGTREFRPADDASAPRVSATIDAAYTLSANRAQSDGFSATSAGDPRVSTWGLGAGPRHTMRFTLDVDVHRVVNVTTFALLTSGYRVTPMVGADINGDGFANDRAFIFDPASTTDPAVASGLEALLASAPRNVRNCLRSQLGRIAQSNSCATAPSVSVGTVVLRFDPHLLHLGNRGLFTIYINNLASALDEVLHGDQHMRGWGQAAYPDPVLLTPAGFDASARAFRYSVNPQFGSVVATSLFTRAPFRVTLDLRLAVGPDVETERVRASTALPPGVERWTVDRLRARLLQNVGTTGVRWLQAPAVADSLHLSAAQRQAVVRAAVMLDAVRDSIFGELSKFLIARQGDYDGETVRSRWHDAFERELRRRGAIVTEVRALLTPEQVTWLAVHIPQMQMLYGDDWLERRVRGPLP